MRKYWLWFGLFLFALLAGCGQQGGPGGGNGGSAPHEANPQQVALALYAADLQIYRIAYPLYYADFPMPLMPFQFLPAATWTCGSVHVNGDLSDSDNDSIPKHAIFDGRCTWSITGEGGTVTGYWEFQNLSVQDPNDGDPNAGIQANGKVVFAVQSPEDNVTWSWELTHHDFVKRTDDYAFTYEGTWQIEADGKTYTFNYDLEGTWNPTDPDDPWGDGTLNAEGNFSGTAADCPSGWSTSVRLTAIQYQGGKIVGGTANLTAHDCDGHTEQITVTWHPTRVCVKVNSEPEVCQPQ